jgi:hypothetical protein
MTVIRHRTKESLIKCQQCVAIQFQPILQNIDGIEHNGFPSPSREEGR